MRRSSSVALAHMYWRHCGRKVRVSMTHNTDGVTVQRTITARCPDCGVSHDATYHEFVDLVAGPHLSDWVMAGDHLIATCPNGHRHDLDAHYLLHRNAEPELLLLLNDAAIATTERQELDSILELPGAAILDESRNQEGDLIFAVGMSHLVSLYLTSNTDLGRMIEPL